MTDVNRLLIAEYLESLKESDELDVIFPMLLEMMGYEVLSKPASAKGQSQYGKDVVAIKEIEGLMTRFYFELKGGSDRNITDTVLMKPDGIIESLRAAKMTPYNDASITGFNTWPIRYVLVHNGLLNENTKATFNGFIESEFKSGEFEHWDISKLSKLFSENLFNEYLLIEGGNNDGLFKKTLALLDVPEYDLNHFYSLVESLCKNMKSDNPRYRNKFYSALGLIGIIIYHYCKSFNNLERAKVCITYIALKSWHCTLEKKISQNANVRRSFESMLGIQAIIYNDYFNKTLPVASLLNGLYVEQSGYYEEIGYSIRCSDYINYLVYYFRLQNYLKPDNNKSDQIRLLANIIQNNFSGMTRPLLDNQGVSYLNVFIFFQENSGLIDSTDFLKTYVDHLFDNIVMIKKARERFPELYNNEEALVEFMATTERPYNFIDDGSTLVLILFEMLVCLNAEELYIKYTAYFTQQDLNLQTFYYEFGEDNTNHLLFDHEIREEGYSETNIKLPTSFAEFVKNTKEANRQVFFNSGSDPYTELMKSLAHTHFKSPFFTNDWRKFVDSAPQAK